MNTRSKILVLFFLAALTLAACAPGSVQAGQGIIVLFLIQQDWPDAGLRQSLPGSGNREFCGHVELHGFHA